MRGANDKHRDGEKSSLYESLVKKIDTHPKTNQNQHHHLDPRTDPIHNPFLRSNMIAHGCTAHVLAAVVLLVAWTAVAPALAARVEVPRDEFGQALGDAAVDVPMGEIGRYVQAQRPSPDSWKPTSCGVANQITSWGKTVTPTNVLPEYPRCVGRRITLHYQQPCVL